MDGPMPSSSPNDDLESSNAAEEPKEASTATTPSPRNKKKYNPPAVQSKEEVVVFVEGGVVTGMSSSQEEEEDEEGIGQATGQWSFPKGRGILDQLLYPEGSPAAAATTITASSNAGSTTPPPPASSSNTVLFRKFTNSWKKQQQMTPAVSVVQNIWKSRQIQQQHPANNDRKEDTATTSTTTSSTTSFTPNSTVPVTNNETDNHHQENLIPKNSSSGDSGGSMDDDGGDSYTTTGSQVSSTYTDESGLLQSSTSLFASKWNSIREAQNINNTNATAVTSLLSFRGRYSSSSSSLMNNQNTSTTTAASNTASGTSSGPLVLATPSSNNNTPVITHATRWKASTAADHYNNLIQNLPKHQYIVLLGRGRFGVNLKQCYSKHNGGVYVDFLVERGAAENSGLVEIGDVIVTVGNVDCRKSNIGAVPTIIANAKRPVAIVLSTSGALETKRINYVDVTVGILQSNWANTFGPYSKTTTTTTTISTVSRNRTPKRTNSEKQTNDIDDDDAIEDEEDNMKILQPTSFDDDDRAILDIPVPPVTLQQNEESAWRIQHPPVKLQQAYANSAAKRNYVPQMMMTSHTRMRSIPDPEDNNMRNALSHAFLLVTTDRRRLPFLLKHLSNSPMASAVVSLWTDILNYYEWFELVTESTRRQWALSILHKYLVPHYASGAEEGSGILQPPTQMDLHHLVSDTTLRELEKVIVVDVSSSESSSQISLSTLTRNIFEPVQFNILSEVSENNGWFLSFITSPDCARMRAYLRNTAPYHHLPLDPFLNMKNHNYWSYVMVYLLCLTTDPEGFGENDDILESSGEKGVRIENSASGMAAALFILQRLSTQPEDPTTWEQLWEFFVAPGGALESGPRSPTVRSYLLELRSTLEQVQLRHEDQDGWIEKSKDIAILLAKHLIYDYAVDLQPKFRAHKFHEWLCEEIYQKSEDGKETLDNWSTILPRGSVKRLLRKASFPVGITPHKHAHFPVESVSSSSQSTCNISHVNAECAVVFGSSVGLDLAAQMDIPAMMMMESNCDIRRYTCESVSPHDDSEDAAQRNRSLTPEEIPASMESYAMATYTPNKKPFFKHHSTGENASCWQSLDGWQVSMVNFLVPRAETASSSEDNAEDFSSSLFGVSLLFQRLKSSLSVLECIDVNDKKITEFINGDDHPNFFRRLSEQRWSDRLNEEVDRNNDAVATIGVALVSQRNVIMAMRNALFLFLQECSDSSSCGKLVQLLGNFAHQDVESMVLKNILEPFIQRSSAPWLEYPVGYQKECFFQCAGQQLIDCLPPVPLALMFVTALLEQKIVFTSSRRSLLFSVVATLSELLKPLRWCHLLVPRVPSSLAGDLLQYPAPFILGLPSEDPGTMDLIRELPDDVTLVDLDVGRVILATSFAHNNELGRGTPNNAETARALRAQVLFLAQSLGNVFASTLNPLWNCDNPFTSHLSVDISGVHFTNRDSKFDSLRKVCKEFVEELLAGTTSCCYWIEEVGEGDDDEPTILFDEDRFFHIKEARERKGFAPLFRNRSQSSGLALSLDDFDLVLELFLRCQSFNAYIGTRHRNEMVY